MLVSMNVLCMIQNNEATTVVPKLWEFHVYNLAFIRNNSECMIQSNETALMAPVLWEAHAYSPALMEHEMDKANACNLALMMFFLWRCAPVTQH